MEDRYSAEEENRIKTRFLSTMSHELRTLMNAIIGMADVALRENMDDNLRKCVSIIKSSSVSLFEIVNDILDLSKIEAGKLTIILDTYTTNSFVNDIMAIIDARNIEGKVPIYYHIQKNMPEVLEGDSVRIEQVMLNLASNAIKYTESSQRIWISCLRCTASLMQRRIMEKKNSASDLRSANIILIRWTARSMWTAICQ